jgi:hypothetical protein
MKSIAQIARLWMILARAVPSLSQKSFPIIVRTMAVLIKPYMPSPAVSQQVGKIVIRQGQLDYLLKLTIKSLLGISGSANLAVMTLERLDTTA